MKALNLIDWINIVVILILLFAVIYLWIRRKKAGSTVLVLEIKRKNMSLIIFSVIASIIFIVLIYSFFTIADNYSRLIEETIDLLVCIIIINVLMQKDRITRHGIIYRNMFWSWKDIKAWKWKDIKNNILQLDIKEHFILFSWNKQTEISIPSKQKQKLNELLRKHVWNKA